MGSPSANIEFFWTQLSAEFKRSDYWLLLRSPFVCAILLSAGKIVHKPSLPHLSRHGSMQSAWTGFLLSCAFIVLCSTYCRSFAQGSCLVLSCLWLVSTKPLFVFYAAIGPRSTILSDITDSKKNVCLQSMKSQTVYFSTWKDRRNWTCYV